MQYHIRIVGGWDPAVAQKFRDVSAVAEGRSIVLSADLDQAGLHGLLERLRIHDIELIDVRRARAPKPQPTKRAHR